MSDTLTPAEKAICAKILTRQVANHPELLIDITRHALEHLAQREDSPDELKMILEVFVDLTGGNKPDVEDAIQDVISEAKGEVAA